MFTLLPRKSRSLVPTALDVTRNAMEEILRDMDRPLSSVWPSIRSGIDDAGDLVETENSFILRLEVPGVTKKDIKVEFVGNTLTVRFSRPADADNIFGSRLEDFTVRRTVENVTSDGITAEVRNGILAVTLPKKTTSDIKTIEVTGE